MYYLKIVRLCLFVLLPVSFCVSAANPAYQNFSMQNVYFHCNWKATKCTNDSAEGCMDGLSYSGYELAWANQMDTPSTNKQRFHGKCDVRDAGIGGGKVLATMDEIDSVVGVVLILTYKPGNTSIEYNMFVPQLPQ